MKRDIVESTSTVSLVRHRETWLSSGILSLAKEDLE
jgi:hypothetical protein